jgi:hypothetical protein
LSLTPHCRAQTNSEHCMSIPYCCLKPQASRLPRQGSQFHLMIIYTGSRRAKHHYSFYSTARAQEQRAGDDVWQKIYGKALVAWTAQHDCDMQQMLRNMWQGRYQRSWSKQDMRNYPHAHSRVAKPFSVSFSTLNNSKEAASTREQARTVCCTIY